MKNDDDYIFIHHKDIFLPQPLIKGDKVMILSTSDFNSQELLGTISVIAQHGFQPQLPESISNGRFQDGMIDRGTRISELHYALEDQDIKGIFCIGNGHGAFEILPNFSYGPIASNPKWLIGSGDATAWLAMWVLLDIAAIHGPNCNQIQPGNPIMDPLFNLLKAGGRFDYELPPSCANYYGDATGTLIGGNLSVMSMLVGTPYDLVTHNRHEKEMILFFEDKGRPLWAVRDMLVSLSLTGVLFFVKGLIFGSFDSCKPYGELGTIQDVIAELQQRALIPFDIPVVFDFPIGKDTQNLPLIEGIKVNLKVTDTAVSLRSL